MITDPELSEALDPCSAALRTQIENKEKQLGDAFRSVVMTSSFEIVKTLAVWLGVSLLALAVLPTFYFYFARPITGATIGLCFWAFHGPVIERLDQWRLLRLQMSDLERVQDQHNRAVDVIWELLTKNRGFGVYLRAFELEPPEYEIDPAKPFWQFGARWTATPRPEVPQFIPTLTRRTPPVFALSSGPARQLPGSVFFLFADLDSWSRLVRVLCLRSSFVLLNAPTITKGIIAEVQLLEELGILDQRVIVAAIPQTKWAPSVRAVKYAWEQSSISDSLHRARVVENTNQLFEAVRDVVSSSSGRSIA